MLVIKAMLCFLVLLVVPVVLGLLVTKFMKEKNNLVWAFVIGYLLEFASFEVIYLPMYFAKCSFKQVQYVWSIVILIIMLISLIINRKRGKELFQETKKKIKNLPSLSIVFLVLLAIQIYVPVRYMQHVDPDDAFYLGSTTTTIETNSMFKFVPYSGQEFGKRPVRYSLSGLVIYFAALSEILHLHPAILQHTIWPAIAVILEFGVYALIGNCFFQKDKEKLCYFLIFLAIVYMFGFISVYTNFSFFAYRSWQGKALVANLIIPAAWLCYRNARKNERQVVYWFVFLVTMISSCFVTEMGVFLVPIEIGILSLISLVQDRKILNFIKPIVCCLPQIIVGLIYIILK